MNNEAIAGILKHISKILEIKGENVFKVRAYQAAAETVAGQGQPLAELARAGRLQDLPGIGEAIAGKITELLDHGRMEYYENLRSSDYAGLATLLDVPGMGPRHTRLVYEKLGVRTVEDLKTAAEGGRLRDLPGLGAKAEQKILQGITQLKKYKHRRPLAFVYPQAVAMLEALREAAAAGPMLLAGSLRRMRETVADVDILVAAARPEAVMEAFVALPQAAKILARGRTKASLITGDGLQVDLRVVAAAGFGAAAHYFTGSKAHNIRIRGLAAEKGLKVNEYGVFKKDTRIAGATEEEVFDTLGLPYILPEMREDRGEIEAALAGSLPRVLAPTDLRGDLHVHSDWSDGRSSLPELAAAAGAKGYRYLAVCDHSPHVAVANGLDAERLARRNTQIDRLNRSLRGLKLLKGIEVDILADGRLDLPDAVLAGLDLVVASVHSRFGMPEDEMTRRIIRAVEHPCVDIIGHPTGRLLGRREPYALDLERLIEACRKHGKALELNAHPDRLDLCDRHCRRARQRGVQLAVSTDAHCAGDLDLMHFGVATARRGWLEPGDVVNTRGVAALRRLFGR